MTPQTVNAVNLPLQNALNFPAAILERPFFDARANDAFNYGAIGAVIGHEISHTFDNQGAAFDEAQYVDAIPPLFLINRDAAIDIPRCHPDTRDESTISGQEDVYALHERQTERKSIHHLQKQSAT